jgi:hypothetical protein
MQIFFRGPGKFRPFHSLGSGDHYHDFGDLLAAIRNRAVLRVERGDPLSGIVTTLPGRHHAAGLFHVSQSEYVLAEKLDGMCRGNPQ